MMPDMIREIIVMAFISAFMRIYPAKITQSIAMKPNCVGENVRLAIIVTVSMWSTKIIKKKLPQNTTRQLLSNLLMWCYFYCTIFIMGSPA